MKKKLKQLIEQVERLGFHVVLWKPDRQYRMSVFPKEKSATPFGQLGVCGPLRHCEEVLKALLLGARHALQLPEDHPFREDMLTEERKEVRNLWEKLKEAYYDVSSELRRRGPILALLYARALAAVADLDVDSVMDPAIILSELEKKGLAGDPDLYDRAWIEAQATYRQKLEWALGPLRDKDVAEANQILWQLGL